jgi:hypothetical protein
MSHKLTADEKDALGDMLTSEAWPAILKLIENLVENQGSKCLTYNLDSGPEGLVIEKARFEGAQRLFLGIQSIKKQHKGN